MLVFRGMITKADKSSLNEFGVIETDFHAINQLTGIGGIPFKKITEISGNYSVGKSTFALSVVATAQRAKMPCLWVDTEYSFDNAYSTLLGVVLSELDLCQERFAEDTLDAIEEWAEKNKNSLIVIDSIGGLLSRQEAEKSADSKTIGGQAKLVATFCRKIVPILAINNIAMIVLNHNFIDLMSGALKTSGGAKLEYHKSLWLRLRKLNKRVVKSGNQIGDVIEFEVRKNKLAGTKMQKTELVLIFGKGFDTKSDILQEALDKEVITKKGQFFYFKDEKIARGQNTLRELFENDSDFAAKIKELL